MRASQHFPLFFIFYSNRTMQRVGGPIGELLNAYFLYYKYTILSPKMLYELLKQILVVRGPPPPHAENYDSVKVEICFFLSPLGNRRKILGQSENGNLVKWSNLNKGNLPKFSLGFKDIISKLL